MSSPVRRGTKSGALHRGICALPFLTVAHGQMNTEGLNLSHRRGGGFGRGQLRGENFGVQIGAEILPANDQGQ